MCNGISGPHSHGKPGFDIEILPDGTVRVLTGDVSGPAHMAAEQFLQFLARELGGQSSRVRQAHGHVHNHVHEEAKH